MAGLLQKINNSDGFIFGSPARWNLLSGELKVFFDRLNPLAVPELLKGKKAVIFVVGQSEGESIDSIKSAANSIVLFCNSAGIEVIEIVYAENCLNPNDLITNYPEKLLECKRAAEKLYIAISESI